MADKIDGYGRPGVDLRPAKSPASAPGTAVRTTVAGGTGTPAPAVQVRITETATRLKRIEAGLNEVPDVDRSRVEAVKQKVDSGSYRVDSRRVALKLMRFERDLAG
jgi:negative regulator of flagellin synthesis FlgM